MYRMCRMACFLVPLYVVTVAMPAAAHPLVDQAWAKFGAADLDSARASIDQAEQVSDLTRADLASAYELRALIEQALGNDQKADKYLTALASIDIHHAFRPEAPPELTERFKQVAQRVGAPMELRVDEHREGEHVTLSGNVVGDPQHLAREIRMHARVDHGEWRHTVSAPLELRVSSTETAEYYGEVMGPGGAVVASRGTIDEPLHLSSRSSGKKTPWVWIGVGGGIVVAAAVVVAVLLVGNGSGERSTQPTAPMIQF